MSSLLRPVGHLPATVYWVRRLLVLALFGALLLSLLRVAGGNQEPSSSAAPDPTPSSSTPFTQTPSPAGVSRDARCDDVLLAVLPAVRRLPAGRPMNLQVRMSVAEGTCTGTVDPTSLVVSINSGRDRIWTSAHCVRAVASATLVLTAGQESTTVVSWDGRRSTPNCTPGPPARRGTYVVQASFGGRLSAAQAFYLI